MKNTVGLIFCSVRLRSVATALFALGLLFVAAPLSARETYQQFSLRMLAKPPEGVVVNADVEAAIFLSTNAYRKAHGLKIFVRAPAALRDAARTQAMDLLAMGKMGHVASTGHDFSSRMRALRPGQMFLPIMAENAARQTKKILNSAENADAVLQQWIKSSGHRKNLLDRSYVMLAVGAVQRGDTVYAVQIFMGPEVKSNLTSGQ